MATWEKKTSLGLQDNILEPLLKSLKEALVHEQEQLIHKLENLKKLGVIQIDDEIFNNKIKELKSKI